MSRSAAALAGTVAFLAIIGAVTVTGAWHGDFRFDEAHKISETAFLGAWLRGDVRNAAWFANVIDRSNPPVGKYVFGAAVLLSGQKLPSFPTLAVHSRDGAIAAVHPEPLSAPYRPLLAATRAASAVATALTAAILVAMLVRYHGWLSATVAVALFALSSLVQTYWAWAVFDPLFALCFTMLIALTASLANATSWRRVALTAGAMGIVAALAFQTRLNGMLAVLVALAFVWGIFGTTRKALGATGVLMVTLAAATLLLNPYYWSAPATPLEPFSRHDGLGRPFQRLLQQKRDLETIAVPLQEGRQEGRTVPEKVRYAGEMLMSELAGLLTVIGAMVGLVLLGRRGRVTARPLRIALLMSLAVVFLMIATLPLPWPRYLLVTVPPLALIAGFGTAEVLSAFVMEMRRAIATARK